MKELPEFYTPEALDFLNAFSDAYIKKAAENNNLKNIGRGLLDAYLEEYGDQVNFDAALLAIPVLYTLRGEGLESGVGVPEDCR